MELKKYFAELVGTFFLTLAVSLSILLGSVISTPVVAALTLGVCVYTLGPVSGAHFNPAISLAMAAVDKMKVKESIMYIVFQLIGAVLAMLLAGVIAGEMVNLEAQSGWQVGLAEMAGAAILAFGVSSVAFGKVRDEAAGLVVGGSLLIGLIVTAGKSNAILNPAVAIGLGSMSFMYLLAPIVGAALAAWVYRSIVE